MHLEVKHGSGITPYYTTIINSTFELCKFLNGTDPNPVAKLIVDAVSLTVPKGVLHPCPFENQFKVSNVSIASRGVLLQFLKGRYKIFIRVFDEKDSEIVTYRLGLEL
jgi:hypothetical protein